MPVSGDTQQRNPSKEQAKAKKPSTIRKRRWNNEGPCPNRACKCPPINHRKIANTKDYFCYGPKCMDLCHPGVRKF